MATQRKEDETVIEKTWDFLWKVVTIPKRVVETTFKVVWPKDSENTPRRD